MYPILYTILHYTLYHSSVYLLLNASVSMCVCVHEDLRLYIVCVYAAPYIYRILVYSMFIYIHIYKPTIWYTILSIYTIYYINSYYLSNIILLPILVFRIPFFLWRFENSIAYIKPARVIVDECTVGLGYSSPNYSSRGMVESSEEEYFVLYCGFGK